MSSSSVKAMLVRSAMADLYSRRRLLKGKYGINCDEIDLLRRANCPSSSSVNFSRSRWWSRRGGGRISLCQESGGRGNGIRSNLSKPRRKQQHPLPSQAILSPVSDPSAPTTKKVILLLLLFLHGWITLSETLSFKSFTRG